MVCCWCNRLGENASRVVTRVAFTSRVVLDTTTVRPSISIRRADPISIIQHNKREIDGVRRLLRVQTNTNEQQLGRRLAHATSLQTRLAAISHIILPLLGASGTHLPRSWHGNGCVRRLQGAAVLHDRPSVGPAAIAVVSSPEGEAEAGPHLRLPALPPISPPPRESVDSGLRREVAVHAHPLREELYQPQARQPSEAVL